MSSEEKIKTHIATIDKYIQQFHKDKNDKSLLNEYEEFLLKEMQNEQIQQKLLSSVQEELKKNQSQLLYNKITILEEKIQQQDNELKTLRDNIDSLSLQTIAQKQMLKSQKYEKEQLINSHIQSEINRLKLTLEEINQEFLKNEQEIKNQIALEKANKSTKIQEIYNNLAKPITMKNNKYVATQTIMKDLKKTLDQLKTEENEKPKSIKINYIKNNIIYFKNTIPSSPTVDVPVKRFPIQSPINQSLVPERIKRLPDCYIIENDDFSNVTINTITQ
ncbi:hypothetical protein ABEB36_006673 [Hypothenemus hampei]|uniref:Uncharacterized protein n=1 Tax=Hypothenemus hampei TaxID=57062 RepID=A0ABD1ERD4_HYPHA